MFAGRGKWKGLMKGPSGLRPQDVFATSLFTSTLAGTEVFNATGINMSGEGGMAWVKPRNSNTGHYLADTLRGGRYTIATETTAAQLDNGANYGLTFAANGFGEKLGFGTSTTMVGWSFRRAPKFFDVVTYTGDGTTGRTISHALGTSPGMVVIKALNSSSDWYTRHRSATGNLYLNYSDGQDSGANLDVPAMDATTFTLRAATTNVSGCTYVAYLFAHDTAADGIVQCGSAVSSSDEGANVFTVALPWQTQFLLVKAVSASGDWMMFDNVRSSPWNSTNQSSLAQLRANSSAAESNTFVQTQNQTSGLYIVYLPGSAFTNYVYMAIREPIL